MNRRRRALTVLACIAATSGVFVLPGARADEPTSVSPATNLSVREWGCVWVDAVDLSVCLSG